MQGKTSMLSGKDQLHKNTTSTSKTFFLQFLLEGWLHFKPLGNCCCCIIGAGLRLEGNKNHTFQKKSHFSPLTKKMCPIIHTQKSQHVGSKQNREHVACSLVQLVSPSWNCNCILCYKIYYSRLLLILLGDSASKGIRKEPSRVA